MSYEIVVPPFTPGIHEKSKPELKDYYKWYMDVLPERIKQLSEEVINFKSFELWVPDYTPLSLKLLGKWFVSQVHRRNRTSAEMRGIRNQSTYPTDIPDWELTDRTFSLAFDIGLYTSQVFLKNHATLKWDQPLKNKRFIDYGQPVLINFSSGPFNPVRMITTSAYGMSSGTRTEDDLIEIYQIWSGMVKQ